MKRGATLTSSGNICQCQPVSVKASTWGCKEHGHLRDERCVFIEPTTFLPESVIVAAGARVTWVNADRRAHKVVSAEGRFRSPFLEAGESYSHEFNEPGVYAYYCRCNPRLGGTIVVEG